MNLAEYRAYQKNAQKSKYKAQKVKIGELVYDSKKEASRGIKLANYERLGIISNLQRQVKYVLQDGFNFNGKTIRPITYVADFVYTINETGEEVVEDVKGVRTEVYKIKKKMFMKKYNKDIKEI